MLYLLIFLLIVLVLLLLFMLVYGVSTISGVIRARGVPYVPLASGKLAFLHENVKFNPTESLVDLGCGNGRVLRYLEKNQGLTELDGYEVNWWAFFLGRVINQFCHAKNKIYFKNFHQVDLSKYDVVYCYLLESGLKRLREKFDRELRPGARIVSFDFPIRDWRAPLKMFEDKKNKLFIYQI